MNKSRNGFTIFFTGLSGAGKSSLATRLNLELSELLNQPITMLDGDEIRQHLSYGLGFSKQDRTANIKRVGFVASEVVKHQGIVICSLIAPYTKARQKVRHMIEQYGQFIEIYLSTSLEVCKNRDPKGLYQKVSTGEIKNFTGIDDPYEIPTDPEIIIDTNQSNIDEDIKTIIDYLTNHKII